MITIQRETPIFNSSTMTLIPVETSFILEYV
jgi:hypothetical protein